MTRPSRLRLALFGHPVAHSRSPELHAAFGRQCGIALDYEAIDVPSPSDGLRALRRAVAAFVAAGGRGANVTLPFKLDAVRLCDTLGAAARRAGAVNTLVVDAAGAIHGENTDGLGLVRDLEQNHGFPLSGRRVALLGTGGAARGVAMALLDAGVAELVVAGRDAGRSAALGHDLAGVRCEGYPALGGGRFDLLVNATSAGLRGELPPLPAGALAPGGAAYDLGYGASAAPFLAWAESAGAALRRDGWGMLVEQAAAAFELWTGVRPGTATLLERR